MMGPFIGPADTIFEYHFPALERLFTLEWRPGTAVRFVFCRLD